LTGSFVLMVTDDEKTSIRECMEALKRGIDGFRSRRPQLQMIAAVANTLRTAGRKEMPGGTGGTSA
jgi:ATP-dependent DNA helicase DinG